MKAKEGLMIALISACTIVGCVPLLAEVDCASNEDCGGHGSCVKTLGTCNCQPGYQGKTCADCATGYAARSDGSCQTVDSNPKNQSCDNCAGPCVAGKCAALDWVDIPAGSFLMGCVPGDPICYEPEKPPHNVSIIGLQLSRTEVTVDQYGKCVEDGVCSRPTIGGKCNWGVQGRENHPFNCVTWAQASGFCQWVGGRLPSEAEWEYAARGGGKIRIYPWGDQASVAEYAVKCVPGSADIGCESQGTMSVCSISKGNTSQGLCDIAGNVWEWVQDWWHDDYTGAPVDGSAWESPAGSLRVARGGGYGSTDAGDLRVSNRFCYAPGYTYEFLGIRCARRP